MRLRLKVELLMPGIDLPPVWRKIAVPAPWSFEQLNDVIQAAMGWDFAHLWQFSDLPYNGRQFIFPDDEDYGVDAGKTYIANNVLISEKFRHRGDIYYYTYDLGDGWLHRIIMEGMTEDGSMKAELLDGAGGCPIEDCGGPPMYAGLVRVAADPNYPDENNYREWLGLEKGKSYDLTRFNLELAQQEVMEINNLYEDYNKRQS